MSAQRTGRRGWPASLIMAGLIVGGLAGPRIVGASTDAAVDIIQGYQSSNQAKVTSSNRLNVDTEADTTITGSTQSLLVRGPAYTSPNGMQEILSTVQSSNVPGCGLISGVVVDGAAAGAVSIEDTVGGSGPLLWQGVLGQGGGHVSDTFHGATLFHTGITVDNPGSVRVILYGILLDPCPPSFPGTGPFGGTGG